MPIFTIDTPQEFFQHIVSTDVSVFLNNEPALRTAYHACTSLLSYRDWVFAAHTGQHWKHEGIRNSAMTDLRQFHAALVFVEPNFAIIGDIANASKHMVVRRGNEPFGSKNTAVTVNPADDSRSINVTVGDKSHDVRACIAVVFGMWKYLNNENGW
jgi:hypothetical protein